MPIIVGTFARTYNHVLLDSIVDGNMAPFAPLWQGNAMWHVVSFASGQRPDESGTLNFNAAGAQCANDAVRGLRRDYQQTDVVQRCHQKWRGGHQFFG